MKSSASSAFHRRWLLFGLAALLFGPGAALSQNGPSVTGVEVTSDAGDDCTYYLDDAITVTLTFGDDVTVTGTPQISIDMNTEEEWGTKAVNYAGGSGTAKLTFTHSVVEPNYSAGGIAVPQNTLSLNGGTIRSTASQTAAELAYDGLGQDGNHKVRWNYDEENDDPWQCPAPEISPSSIPTPTPTPTATPTPPPLDPPGTPLKVRSINVLTEGDLGPGLGETFGLCEPIAFEVTFNRRLDAPDVDMIPRSAEGGAVLRFLLEPGADPVIAKWLAGAGSSSLRFYWRVGGANRYDNADDACPTSSEPFVSYEGIAFPANAVTINGEVIPSAAIGHNRNFRVDSTLPKETSAYDLDCQVTTPVVEQVDTRELEVTWAFKNGYAFCDAGGWFVDIRTDGGPWGSHRVSLTTSNRAYRHGTQYGVHYEFRIRAVDVRGRKVDAPDASGLRRAP